PYPPTPIATACPAVTYLSTNSTILRRILEERPRCSVSLHRLGFKNYDIYTTLENRMKCGVGKCGRCNVGDTYICKEGPVFTAEQVENLEPEL
ncbi:MAG: hypothetical protein HKL95_04535, partial [Phycisphaerae bacterium]|nr:hypothetical protein [Phycisphaerae bacterium]